MMFTRETFYKSKQWETFRQIVINERTNKDGFVICELCGMPIVRKYDLIVDHIEELTDANVNDVNISLNPSNVRCLHFKCHNERHQRFGYGNAKFGAGGKKVYIVYGAPCSGKTTWVSEVAGRNDLIVDMDSIYEMISINPRYIKPDSLRSAAFEIRDSIYNIIKYRSGRWENAFVIVGGARSGDRIRLKERLGGAEFIFIDTPKDECLSRVEGRGSDWKRYIEEWFEQFQPD